jgi:hypothetical protein
MNRRNLAVSIPLLAFVAVGSFAIAQSASTGRVFPYVGYLEEDGFPVDGTRDMRVALYDSDVAGVACDVHTFDDVVVSSGRFLVQVQDVPNACLINGELFADIAVGPVDGTLIDLSTGVGSGRVQLGAVPFAAASPKAAILLAESDIVAQGDVVAGSAFIGDVGHGSGWAGFAHDTAATQTGYALLQNGSGTETLLNTAPGGSIRMRVGNADRVVMDSSGNLDVNGDIDTNAYLYVGQGAHFDCPSCGSTTALRGSSNWGDLTIQGRVLSTNSALHLSPPSGSAVIIDDLYGAAGGTRNGSGAGLNVQGDVAVGGQMTFSNSGTGASGYTRQLTRDVHSWGGTYGLYCLANEYVCGIWVRDEGNQGSGDDTGLNGIGVRCCSFGG